MITTFNDTYEVRSVIGKGGMSTIYLAEHKRLHTNWAVKEVSKHQSVKFDFLAESNILKRLQHPMLPRIVDIFETEDNIYIVEDLVKGETLQDYLRKHQTVDEIQGLQWFRDLCSVLRYLHTQPTPIIYRDMKPSNIMVQPDQTLKLIDFGIAREYKAGQADTLHAATKGYGAPEQLARAATDARTDIYSLGVTMYHLLTGRSPSSLQDGFVPVRQLNPRLSPGTEFILSKCIQEKPEDRYQSVDDLLEDLTHIYRFDQAWKRVQRKKHLRTALVTLLFVSSIGLMAGGRMLMAQEKEDSYSAWLSQANQLYTADYDGAVAALDEARKLFPDRTDADRQQTYALYLNGRWQDCVDFGSQTLESRGPDAQIQLSVASAHFELGNYETAAEGFSGSESLTADNLRDYAVCLGRMGKIQEAEAVLSDLTASGTNSEVTRYVRGEVSLAQEKWLEAEEFFLSVLEETSTPAMVRRCCISLGDLYRSCAALVRVNASPIPHPATKSAQVLSSAVSQEALRYDTVLWETLAMAYFEAYHTDASVPQDYLVKAADCFTRVLDLGVTKEYLYSNLYTIYYELKDYKKAETALQGYEGMYPDSYMPHAFRSMMQITIENQKPQSARNYRSALAEYEAAGRLIRNTDDTTYYQQLESLIRDLKNKGWL